MTRPAYEGKLSVLILVIARGRQSINCLLPLLSNGWKDGGPENRSGHGEEKMLAGSQTRCPVSSQSLR